MVEPNGAYKQRRHEKSWLNFLCVMFDTEVFATRDRRTDCWPVGRTRLITQIHVYDTIMDKTKIVRGNFQCVSVETGLCSVSVCEHTSCKLEISPSVLTGTKSWAFRFGATFCQLQEGRGEGEGAGRWPRFKEDTLIPILLNGIVVPCSLSKGGPPDPRNISGTLPGSIRHSFLIRFRTLNFAAQQAKVHMMPIPFYSVRLNRIMQCWFIKMQSATWYPHLRASNSKNRSQKALQLHTFLYMWLQSSTTLTHAVQSHRQGRHCVWAFLSVSGWFTNIPKLSLSSSRLAVTRLWLAGTRLSHGSTGLSAR